MDKVCSYAEGIASVSGLNNNESDIHKMKCIVLKRDRSNERLEDTGMLLHSYFIIQYGRTAICITEF